MVVFQHEEQISITAMRFAPCPRAPPLGPAIAAQIHEEFQREGKTAGRKKEWYRVNPRIFDIGAVIPDLDAL